MAFSEQSIIEHLLRVAPRGPAVEVGIGHDAAVVRSPKGDGLVLKCDQTIEDVHFVRSEQPLGLVGRKALARVLSDLGAVGARPVACLCALAIPENVSEPEVRALFDGMLALAQRDGVSLVGGDLSRTHGGIALDVSALGFLEGRSAMLRAGAQPGDVLAVTGPLGGSREGWHLRFEPRWREGIALAESGAVHAAIDLSDGLARDLHHVCRASRVGARVELATLPLRPLADGRSASVGQALQDGEDFELLLAIAPRRFEEVARLPALASVRVTRIGVVTAAEAGIKAVDATGNVTDLPLGGYQHRFGA
jgi:thiamine-monophosphate kinase